MSKSIVNSKKVHIEQEDLIEAAKLTPGRAAHGERGVLIKLMGGGKETRLYTDFVNLTYEQWCLLLETLDEAIEARRYDLTVVSMREKRTKLIELLCILDL